MPPSKQSSAAITEISGQNLILEKRDESLLHSHFPLQIWMMRVCCVRETMMTQDDQVQQLQTVEYRWSVSRASRKSLKDACQ